MDAAATQSQTTFSTTNPHSPSKIAANSNSTDIVQLNASNLIKNKRKNFNPRCSANIGGINETTAGAMSSIAEMADLSKRSLMMMMPSSSSSSSSSSTTSSSSSPSSALLSKLSSPLITLTKTPHSSGIVTITTPTPTITTTHLQNTLSTSVTSSCSELEHKNECLHTSINNNQTYKGGTGTITINAGSNTNRSQLQGKLTQQSSAADSEAISLNWRQLLANHQQSVIAAANLDRSTLAGITNSNGPTGDEMALYKIPNTNFSITKTSPITNPLGVGLVGNRTLDPESKAEFAFNAFTAVQELLNVYGLSISPGDIVEAFKKQQQGIGGILQPPTPPRSPTTTTTIASASAAAAAAIGTTSPSSFVGANASTSCSVGETNGISFSKSTSTKNDSLETSNIHINSNNNNPFNETTIEEITISPASITSSTTTKIESINATPPPPHITLAPVSKLMCVATQNYQQQQQQQQQQHHQHHQHHHHQHHQQQQNIENLQLISRNNFNNSSECGDDRTTGTPDDDNDDDNDEDDDNDDDDNDDDDHDDDDNDDDRDHEHDHDDDDDDDEDGDGDGDEDDIGIGGGVKRNNNNHHHQQEYFHHQHNMPQTSSTSNDQDVKENSSDRDNNSPRAFDMAKINDDSNFSTTERHSDDQGSDDYCSGTMHPMDFDTSRISVKNVENLLDKCSLGLFSPILQLAQMQNEDKQIHVDNIKNLTKFSSYLECKNKQCQLENLREHYHCYDLPCFGKVLSKKEEIIRHLKWHKKRNESLNHGFLRFSSSDDCSGTFGPNCTHNRKQTHYHCFQPNCDKVYISTSDVQMHSNYHRKDSAIFQEGFQRYRATEECNADYCMFSGQRTTHFHCRRDNCRFTFKNKADMEKHKSYHIKDLQLARDGFKKFLKTEACPYDRCRFSRICNHIHCVRENCYYVLHSSGQLLSHKRKHERIDSEQAYRRFKMIQKAALFGQDLTQQLGKNVEIGSKPSTPSTSSSAAISPDLQIAAAAAAAAAAAHGVLTTSNTILPSDLSSSFSVVGKSGGGGDSSGSISKPSSSSTTTTVAVPDLSIFYGATGFPLEFLQQIQQRQQLLRQAPASSFMEAINSNNDSKFQQPISPIQQQQQHNSQLDAASSENLLVSVMTNSNFNIDSSNTGSNNTNNFEDIEHVIRQYFTDNCTRQIGVLDLVQQQQQQQQQQTEPLDLNLKSSDCKQERTNSNNTISGKIIMDRIECFLSTNEPHMHCLIKDCEAVVPRALGDITDHMRMHELNRNAENLMQSSNLLQITSIEGFFNRKRGRPPKNRVVEVYNNAQQPPQAIFTSFKLEKTLNEPSSSSQQQSSILRTTPSVSQISSHILGDRIMSHQETEPTVSDDRNLSSDLKFRVFQPNEKCIGQLCVYAQQMHFHCTHGGGDCKFTTAHGHAMDLHMNKCHGGGGGGAASNYATDLQAHVIEGFKKFDIGGDCGVHECNSRGVKSHFHCTRCCQQIISQADLQLHICICNPSGYKKSGKSSFSSNTSLPSISKSNSIFSNSSNSPSSCKIEMQPYSSTQEDSGSLNLSSIQQGHCDGVGGCGGTTSGVGGGGGGVNEKLIDDGDLDCNFGVKSESSEDDRVSVVRAAGTYFPENSDISEHSSPMLSGSQQQQQITTVEAIPICQRPFCKLKRKLHEHCELCNQAFSDKIKLKIHRIKHSSTMLGHHNNKDADVNNQNISPIDNDNSATIKLEPSGNSSSEQIDQPQDLSLVTAAAVAAASAAPSPQSSSTPNISVSSSSMAQQPPPPPSVSPLLPTNFVDNFSMQNLHLAQLALYQQNPFYYQNFYPFLGSHGLPISHTEFFKSQFEQSSTSVKSPMKPDAAITTPFPFVAAAAAAAAAASGSNTVPQVVAEGFAGLRQKRKADDYNSVMDLLPAKKVLKSNKQGNFKIFKDEPVPHGYLKFRFNEDCNFPNCGYRNHQSHFHCRRNDCYYSFCDKTRFVQHTARHERLDKLMGDDFKQFRANMRCGYEDCAYNKNIAGQNNKSSHFHCLKCNFICSDTNKVVAHRRQHSKMEFIRMAGFRKVANNEKCSTSKDHDPSNGECTYSLKQTHYHCLICDCSVLSRAQLGSHRHRVQ